MDPMQSNDVAPPQDNQSDGEMTPMDEVIGKVQSYVQDPGLITPQTMGELLADLQDLKKVVDGEGPGGAEPPQASPIMDMIRGAA